MGVSQIPHLQAEVFVFTMDGGKWAGCSISVVTAIACKLKLLHGLPLSQWTERRGALANRMDCGFSVGTLGM